MRKTIGRMGRLACFLLFLAVMLCSVGACAQEAVQVTVKNEEWSWEPGEVATFSGTVYGTPEVLNGTVLQVTIDAQPRGDEEERIVFTGVNGSRIKVRKQSETYALKEEELSAEIPFTGSWFVPEGSMAFQAVVTVTVLSGTGETLGSGKLEFGMGGETGEGTALLRIPFDTEQLILWMTVGTGVIWVLAGLRIMICRKKRRS